MFTINPDATLRTYPLGTTADSDDSGTPCASKAGLGAIIQAHPGEFAVKLWNHLPGVTPINTPKFRNRSTAIERIWGKLCELYPDAVPSEEMPKAKVRHAARTQHVKRVGSQKRPVGKGAPKKTTGPDAQTNGRSSAWATELTEALRKRFNPGEDFALEDVYKLIPVFQRRHPENKHVAARLRATVAQDLRGKGIVKSLKRGKYRMLAA